MPTILIPLKIEHILCVILNSKEIAPALYYAIVLVVLTVHLALV